jgi:glycosyltransferase involved in cell wall biosynthesis
MSEKPRKKVLLLITKSNFGGAQRYIYDLATSMPRESFDVVVAFGEGGELEQKLRETNTRTLKIDALQRDVGFFKDFRAFFELLRIFKKEKPDVLHLNSTKAGGLGAVAGTICRIPKIIFTAHGWAFNESRGVLSKTAIAFFQWLTVMFSDVTIAVSQKTADQILTFPLVGKNKIKVIYNGVAEIGFTAREEARRSLQGGMVAGRQAGAPTNTPTNTPPQNQPFWIGTISELHRNKGIDLAITAFAEIAQKYPQTIFVAIGGGEEKDRLNRQIIELGLTDRAFLIGFVTDAKKYLKAFDLFTLTSRTEALPYAILEAGLAELPVVASAVGGIPEIINSQETGILISVNENNSEKMPRGIAGAFEQLIANPAFAKKIGQNLKRRVTADFSQQKMLTETFGLYQ